MDEQKDISKNIIDKRTKTVSGLSALVGFLLGFFGSGLRPKEGGPDDDLIHIVSTALDKGDDFWAGHMDKWRSPHVILIDANEKTACGDAGPSTGPFYCPKSERIYIDLNFLRSIDGALAQAYEIAHELGHHVEKLRNELNTDSISIELLADCYAGMWMREWQELGHVRPEDITTALTEASAVGDDRICPTCSIEQWTHGSSAQRVEAVTSGITAADCDHWRFPK